MIKALIFDFDGLILDTEGPEYQSWLELYAAHGCDLPFQKWSECTGTTNAFDPHRHLEELVGRSLDRVQIQSDRRARFDQLMAGQGLLPGVETYIAESKALGLRLGLASSSRRSWVMGYLTQFRLTDNFHAIRTADDVEKTKPDPALYLSVLDSLEIQASQAIALEDSPNGILA